jgi:hypothetical protein
VGKRDKKEEEETEIGREILILPYFDIRSYTASSIIVNKFRSVRWNALIGETENYKCI